MLVLEKQYYVIVGGALTLKNAIQKVAHAPGTCQVHAPGITDNGSSRRSIVAHTAGWASLAILK